MIVLDTTVLVYAVGVDHPLREACVATISAVAEGSLAATTTVEVIQEFTHVRARRRGRADATAIARDFSVLLAPLWRPDDGDLMRGLELYRAHEQLGMFDAVLAATVLNSTRLTEVMSADRAFSAVPGLTHRLPTTPSG